MALKSKGSVLLVEDDHDIRVAVRSILEEEGYEVFTAAHGREAIALLNRATTTLPRLVLIDLKMPVMDGWELISLLKDDPRLSALPLVVLTGLDQQPPGPITAFLRKPLEQNSLLAMARHYCG